MKRTRRNHGAAFKAQVALAACTGDKTLAELAAHFGVHPTQITDWKRHLLERVADVFGGTTHKPDAPDLKVLHAKIGQLAPENDFLDGALTKAGLLECKAMIDRTHARPVGRQCQLLALSRSTTIYQRGSPTRRTCRQSERPLARPDPSLIWAREPLDTRTGISSM